MSKSGSLQSALSPFLFACAHGSSQHPLVKCCHLSGPWQAENISQSIKAVSLQCVSMVGNDWFTTDPWELRSILSCKPHRIPNYITGRLESRKELLSYHPSQHICTSHCANQTVLTCSHHWLLCDQKALSRTVWKSDRTVATTETDSEVFRVVFVLRNRFKQQLQ